MRCIMMFYGITARLSYQTMQIGFFRMAPRRSTSAGRDKASTTNKRNCKEFVIQHKFNTKFNINFGNAKWLEKCVFYDYDFSKYAEVEMSRNVQSGNTQNLKSMVIQRSFPKWSVAERRKTAAASNQAACCACTHSRYLAGGSPSGLRV